MIARFRQRSVRGTHGGFNRPAGPIEPHRIEHYIELDIKMADETDRLPGRLVGRSSGLPDRRSAGGGLDPDDWRPMPSIGAGVREIRVQDRTGAFRVIYVAALADAIYVLHAFQKKTRQTSKRDLDLATSRLREEMARMR
jgi:hypothetical protein